MLELQDLRDFSITSWYDKFKDITLRTVILDVPEEFVEKRLKYREASDNSDDNSDEDQEEPIERLGPSEFIDKLNNALNSFDCNVFVKNNWHAPIDARMFSFGNTLKTSNIDDIILYFTTSGIIQEDLKTKSVPTCLALRKWIAIHPAAEFRCIVIRNVLRGITPRDWPTFYPHFQEEGPKIISSLSNFFKEHIKENFLRSNYTLDVVLSYPDKPFLLDFGPLNSKTNLYAFSWKEIGPLINKVLFEEATEEIPPVFRYLESDLGIMSRASALKKLRESDLS